MARNDGKDRTNARDGKYTRANIGNIERHNERKNEIYQNSDIQLDKSDMNIYFKKPTDTYISTFDKMCEDGTISTKGLQDGAIHYGELLFDVNTTYFEERGGYEYAKDFFAKAYEYAVQKVGGEQYILSAVMHADERNSAVSEQLGKDVYHYHLHVIYVPVVQKEVKWSKRCKDKSLVGTVKEVITQVSHSKKWASHKEIGEDGKPHLVKSYSILQDEFFNYMRDCGYKDIERGEKGSTDRNITATELKVQKEKSRLQNTVAEVQKAEHILHDQTEVIGQNQQTIAGQKMQIQKGKTQLNKVADIKAKIVNIDSVETKPTLLDKSKITVDKAEFENLKTLAQKQVVSVTNERKLSADNKQLKQENQALRQTNTKQQQELLEFKSVRNKLSANKDKMRVAELEKFYDVVMRFLEKFKLREQFERFSKMRSTKISEVER
ncbi:MAG: plasmid recombination protein [Lachnospiraceae bacterium]